MKTLYPPVSTAHGGRDGHVRSHEGAEALMRVAHEVWPYSSATCGNIEVKLVAG
jgi:organic hydroperoxide reductase OsmC/OhrA